MIIDSFDDKSEAIINPHQKENAPIVDACIITFSHIIEKFVLENYQCNKIAQFKFATGITPIYQIEYKGKKFAFYKTYIRLSGQNRSSDGTNIHIASLKDSSRCILALLKPKPIKISFFHKNQTLNRARAFT